MEQEEGRFILSFQKEEKGRDSFQVWTSIGMDNFHDGDDESIKTRK